MSRRTKEQMVYDGAELLQHLRELAKTDPDKGATILSIGEALGMNRNRVKATIAFVRNKMEDADAYIIEESNRRQHIYYVPSNRSEAKRYEDKRTDLIRSHVINVRHLIAKSEAQFGSTSAGRLAVASLEFVEKQLEEMTR